MQATLRVAVKDDVIPLGVPFTDTRGVLHDNIKYVVLMSSARIITDDSGLGSKRAKLCSYPSYHLTGINIIGVKMLENSSQLFLIPSFPWFY